MSSALRHLALSTLTALALAACGGGGSGSSATDSTSSTTTETTTETTTSTDTTSDTTSTTATDTTSTTTTTADTGWTLATGAHAPDQVDTSAYLPLSIALDTMGVSSSSTRLTVLATSDTVTTVALDGVDVITLTRDTYGLTIRSVLSGDTHVAYQLSGSGTTPLTVYSDNAYRIGLNGATIASPDGPALNLQSKQTAFIQIEGSNRLADASTWSSRTTDDGASMDLKATLFAEGAVVLRGSGSLQVTAVKKHALASDNHVRLQSGSVTLTASAKDGLRANDAFVMDGGTLTITTPAGKGIKVDGQEDDSLPLGFIAINAGTLNITSHDKAITAAWEGDEDGDTTTTADDPDPRVTINGGTISITTTGTPYEDTNTADGDDSLSPEGIEAKSVLTVNGGTITVNSTDDALNAGTGIAITGGRVYAASSRNDAIDSNGTLRISGGYVVASGAAGAEGGLDCDNNTFTVTGGVFVGLGGRNSSVTTSVATQNSVSARSVTTGQWTLRDASGNAAFSFMVPTAASAMLVSSPLISTGTTYTVVRGGTLGGVGETFQGLAINPTTHSGGTTGTSFTVSGRVTAL